MEFNSQNELLINYKEQTVAVSEKSDQGQACVNTVEAVYLVSVILAIIFGIGIVHNLFDDFLKVRCRWSIIGTVLLTVEKCYMNKISLFNISIEGKETYHSGSRTIEPRSKDGSQSPSIASTACKSW